MDITQAFDCGVRSRNMGYEQATRSFYVSCGISSTMVKAVGGPSDTMTYDYWCPERDPPTDLLQAFWDGYRS